MLSIGRLDDGHKYRLQTKHLAKLKTVYTEFANQKMMCVSITTLEICVLQLDTCNVIKEDYLDIFFRKGFPESVIWWNHDVSTFSSSTDDTVVLSLYRSEVVWTDFYTACTPITFKQSKAILASMACSMVETRGTIWNVYTANWNKIRTTLCNYAWRFQSKI